MLFSRSPSVPLSFSPFLSPCELATVAVFRFHIQLAHFSNATGNAQETASIGPAKTEQMNFELNPLVQAGYISQLNRNRNWYFSKENVKAAKAVANVLG